MTIRPLARATGALGLCAAGGLHLLWAGGWCWPAASRPALAEAVVGRADAMPPTAATGIVGVGAVLGGFATAGALGEGRAATSARWVIAAALLARAAAGGGVALEVLGLPSAGERFRRLDVRVYRPLCLALGLAVLLGSGSSPGETS